MNAYIGKQDRADLIDALQDAIDELSERAFGKYADYEKEDLPEIEAKLDRWSALITKLVDGSTGRRLVR